jgi:adenylate cyclase
MRGSQKRTRIGSRGLDGRVAALVPRGRMDLGAVGFLAALLVTAVVTASLGWLAAALPGLFEREHQLSDFRTAWLAERASRQHPKVVVVTLDEDTLSAHPYDVMDRRLLARIVQALDRAGVAAIGLDVLVLKPSEPEKDDELLAALRAARAPVVLAYADRRARLRERERSHQRAFVEASRVHVGYANLHTDRDDVVRRKAGPATPPDVPVSFAARLAASSGNVDPAPTGRIDWLSSPAGGVPAFLHLKGETLTSDPRVLAALAPRLAGRVVLVGGAFEDRDRHAVPIFDADALGDKARLPGVHVHAHILAQILDGRPIVEPEVWLAVAPVVFFAFLVGWSFRGHGWGWIGRGTLATGILIAVDMALFWRWRIVLPYTPVTIAWIVGALAGLVVAGFVRPASAAAAEAIPHSSIRGEMT